MKDIGFTVDQQPRDWPTVLARRSKREGWSMFLVYSNGADMFSPLSHFDIAPTCSADYPGWSCDNQIPALLEASPRRATLEERRKIAAEVQAAACALTPSAMWVSSPSRPAIAATSRASSNRPIRCSGRWSAHDAASG